MNTREIVRRIEAFGAGRPQPHGDTLHVHLAKDVDILMVAFLRMGGESAPWAIGYAKPRQPPVVLTVPEPRNRDLVADMVVQFAPVLLGHLRHPAHSRELLEGDDHGFPLRQVWLPNRSHLDMLHHVAYTYTFTRWGARERVNLLNQVGRGAGWLFREACRPGQQVVMIGTEALTESYTFPAETVRQGHLGFLLAWMEASGDRDARMTAAAEAERLSVSTSLDPRFERDPLLPIVDAWNEAKSAERKTRQRELARQIQGELEPEVHRRLRLVGKAIRHLCRDDRSANPGVEVLAAASTSEHWFQYVRLESDRGDERDGPAYTSSPETDRYPAAAASRFFVHEKSEELRVSVLIAHDAEMRAEAVTDGDAFVGTITAVRDEGTRRKMLPVWTIEGRDDGPLRLREGNLVCVSDAPDRTGTIRQIERLPNRKRRYEVEIKNWKRAKTLPGRRILPAANSPELVGQVVLMLAATMPGISRVKSQRVWSRQGPGAWLTHAMPTGARAVLPREVGEDMETISEAMEGE